MPTRTVSYAKEAIGAIRDRGTAEVIIEPTLKACEEYSRLYRKGKCVALFPTAHAAEPSATAQAYRPP